LNGAPRDRARNVAHGGNVHKKTWGQTIPGRLEASARTLLIIDDDERVLKNWRRLLADSVAIAAATTFEAGWTATEQARWHERPFDYVFLDLQLPDGNGKDLLGRLNAVEPRPAVAVISGFLDAHEALTIHSQCVIAVPKPADRDVLLGLLALLEGSRSGASLIARFATEYALSPQETRLLMAAANETRNEDAADQLGCTHATVRSYWRRIFVKTGRSSAREVITLLFRFAMSHSLQECSAMIANRRREQR
jgi:DNA-binding NarL/FixJ family response regulator